MRTIVVNDEIPSLSLSNATASELDGQLEFEVTLEGSSTATVATTVVTAGGTATADVDYENIAVSVTWAPGESGQKTVQVPILDDTTDEYDETFSISLLSTQNATETVATAAATITDDAALLANAPRRIEDFYAVPRTVGGTD